MVRVIYRWQVETENFDAFRKIWRTTTNRIHGSVDGAQGSMLLRSCEDETLVLTMAKWDSLASWQRFWGKQNPKEMAAMRQLGERISAEAFEEVEDQTKQG